MPIQFEDLTLFSLSELEDKLSVKRKTLLAYIREGKLKARKIGREQFVTEQNFLDFLEAKES